MQVTGEIEEDIQDGDINGVVNSLCGDALWFIDGAQLIECCRDLNRNLCSGRKSQGHLINWGVVNP